MNVARSARQEGRKTLGFACQLFTTVRYVYFTDFPDSVFYFCSHAYREEVVCDGCSIY